MSDPIAGAEARPGATATEAQLVQASANRRIQYKARRAEVELMKGGCQDWILYNQAKIREKSIPVPVRQDGSEGEAESRWSWALKTMTAAELEGLMLGSPDGGSTAPENTPQKRQDGLQLLQSFANHPLVRQDRLIQAVLEKFDIKNPETWLAPQEPAPAPEAMALQKLVQSGRLKGEDAERAMQVVQAEMERVEEERGRAAA